MRERCLILLVEAGADLRQGAPPELLSRERELSGLIRSQAQYQMELSLNGRDASELAEVSNEIAPLRAEYHEIQGQLRVQNPQALSLARFEPMDLQQIQNELRDNDTLLLEVALGDERSHLWAVTSKSLHSYELPARKIIDDAASEVYKLVTARQRFGQVDSGYQAQIEDSDKLFLEKASRLSEMLFGPVAEHLGTRRLVLVTEGALQLVPFDALPAPLAKTSGPVESKPLVLNHEIIELQSVSTLRAIRAGKNQRGATSRIAAVIADPVFTRSDDRVQYQGLSSAIASAAPEQNRPEFAQRALEGLRRGGGPSRLAHASEEADAISAAAPRGTTMVAKGFDANRETAMSPRVGEYQIVHFATHGFLDSEHPELSGIVLTLVDRNGVETNGLMPLHDIYGLDLAAELTVLSACQTALGKDIKGEGLVGLTHSFMSAGSKSVVASLWKVDDRATAILMADFYQAMLQKGMTPAAALRSAKLKMMQDKRWSAPYFWAGFIVQGEYTNHIAVENNSWALLGVVLLFCLVVISSGPIIFKRLKRRSFPAERNRTTPWLTRLI